MKKNRAFEGRGQSDREEVGNGKRNAPADTINTGANGLKLYG
jgi:hypothetical protein